VTAPRRYFAACGAIIGWSAGIVLPGYGRWPKLFYDPAAHRWFFARTAGALPLSYYGLLLWGILGALLGAGAGRLLGKRRSDARSIGLCAAWTLTAVIGTLAYYTFELWPQIGH
jgi:hypothetical protein